MNDPKLDEAVSRVREELKHRAWLEFSRSDIETILTALSSLQVENEKLREDKELLDWLGTSKCHALTTFTEEEVANMSELMPIDINSFREAIRNAMKGTQ